MITLPQLQAICPVAPSRSKIALDGINASIVEADLSNTLRLAAFIAQTAHESGCFRYFEEIASGEAYEGRKDLGNTQPGDGKRYKGRGPIQITGRANYAKAGAALGLMLVEHPEMASEPAIGFRIACWFWTTRGLNALADRGDMKTITKRINGGLTHYAERLAYYERALRVLGVVR